MKRILFVLLAGLMCVASASAQEIAYDWDGVTGWARHNGALTSGNVFVANENIIVTKLGAYNNAYGGAVPDDTDYPVELYEIDTYTPTGGTAWSQFTHTATGTLLATVGIGTGADVEESIGAGQYVTLANPVTLTAGKTYILNMDSFATYHGISDNIEISNVTVGNEITHVDDFFSYSSPGGIAVGEEFHVRGADTHYVGGPSMIYIPEPVTVCLLGVGALTLIKRKRA